MVYILTSTDTVLKTIVRSQQSQTGDPSTKALLNIGLRKTLTNEAYKEQQEYLNISAVAAFMSLNKLDQQTRYRAGLNLVEDNNNEFNFNQGSSSSGLGYALALFETWWTVNLQKESHFKYPVFATGEVLTSGHVKEISHICEKIDSTCRFVSNNPNDFEKFYICYPQENDGEITEKQRSQVVKLGGILCPAARLQNVLFELLGDNYNGDPLGRWTPFKGLKSFDYEDNLRFFGRTTEIERLYQDLHHNNGLLIVSGASGTGKSSLIKAGLIPRLEQESNSLYWAYATPSKLPSNVSILEYVLEQLNNAWAIESKTFLSSEFKEILKSDIEKAVKDLNSCIGENHCRCVIYLDQFEEVFSQSLDKVSELLKVLDELSAGISNLEIVIALRNEYLGRLLDNQSLSSPVISNVASQISAEGWYAIIHEQAAFSGITFEKKDIGESLDKLIINEAISTPYALPMVEFLLEQLYVKATEGDAKAATLLYRDYEQLGGLNGAIAYRANQVLSEYAENEQIIKQLFEKFVGLNGEQLAFAKHVELTSLSEEQPQLFSLVKRFIDANLIISNESNSSTIARFVHDSLFANWQSLKDWIENSKSYLSWRYLIDGQYLRWLQSGKSNKNLITDSAILKEGKKYLDGNQLTDIEVKKYLSKSIKNKTQSSLRLLVATVILPMLILSTYLWDQYRIKSYYYSAIGEKWGVPFGIKEVEGEQRRKLGKYYRLDFKGGVLRAMNYQNSKGTLIANTDKGGSARLEYSYTDDGLVHSVKHINSAGKSIQVNNYLFDGNDSVVIELGFKKGNQEASALRLRKTYENKYSDITHHKLTFDENGYVAKKEYLNAYGKEQSVDGGPVFSNSYTYYPSGLLKSDINLGQDGLPLTSRNINGYQLFYDENFHNTVREYLTFFTGEQLIVGTGVMEYDEWGNNILIKYLNHNMQLTSGPEQFAVAKIEYDSFGNQVEASFFDSHNRLTSIEAGFAKKVTKLDQNGRIEKESYFDHYGRPAYVNTGQAQGVTSVKIKYDVQGNVFETQYLDADGLPTMIHDGFSKVTLKYDLQGNIIEESYFDNHDNPIMVNGEYATLQFKYNKQGLQTEIRAFNINMEPSIVDGRFHIVKSTFDDSGNTTSYASFDKDGKPTVDEDGFWKVINEYDDFNRPIKQIALNPDGSNRMKFKNDELGNQTEIVHFDERGQRVMEQGWGCSKITHRYDQNRNQIETMCFDTNDMLVVSKFGFAKEVNEYDVSGTYLKRKLTYDSYGRLQDPIKVNDAKLGKTPSYWATDPKHVEDFNTVYQRASSGDLKWYIKLGLKYAYGVGTERNISEARHWYTKLIDSDVPIEGKRTGLYYMGESFSNGLDGVADYYGAFPWYKKSADLGNHNAMEKLGQYYLQGKAIPKDNVKGIEWLRKSAQLGNEDAQNKLKELGVKF